MGRGLDFFLKKLGFSVVTLFAVITFNFLLFRIVPGDPVKMLVTPRMRPETRERLRQEFGIDKPLWLNIEEWWDTGKPASLFDSQFFRYVGNLARGELGESFRQRRPVSELLASRLGPTVLLIVTGQFAGILFGTFLGLMAAWRRGAIDAVAMLVSLTLWALPPFWLGIILLMMARGKLPMGGFITPGTIYSSPWEQYLDIAKHLALPAATMALMLFGAYMLIVRNATLEVMAEDYVLTAKAKGLNAWGVIRAHVLKNISLPLTTIIAMDIGYALGGMIQIETIFSWPGVGRLMFESIGQRDYPVLQGIFLMLAVAVIAANFLADITYRILDPRVKA